MKGKNTISGGKTLGVAPLLGIQSTLFDYLFTYFCASQEAAVLSSSVPVLLLHNVVVGLPSCQ